MLQYLAIKENSDSHSAFIYTKLLVKCQRVTENCEAKQSSLKIKAQV